MAIIIDPDADLGMDTPSFAVGPEGATLIKAFGYPNYFSLQGGDPINTYQSDFYAAQVLGYNLFGTALDSISDQAWANGEEVLAYFVYQKPVLEIAVPDQFCFLDQCWTPPFAGQTIVSGYQYRVWVLTRDIVYGPFPKAVQGSVLLAIVIIAGLVALLPQLVGLVQVLEGKLTWGQFAQQPNLVEKIIQAPGDNVARAEAGLAIPLLFLGGGLAGFAFLLARMEGRKSITVSQPTLAGGRVEVTGATR